MNPMRLLRTIAGLSLFGSLGCAEPPSIPTSSFSLPIDFSYACEGPDGTTSLQYVSDGSGETWCANVVRNIPGQASVELEGALYGLVLNQDPPGVLVVALDPTATNPGGAVLDADPFVPGYTAVPVGANPIRILRASDWGSFYIVSAGSQSVTRLVLKTASTVMTPCDQVTAAPGETPACYETETFDLPGTPSDAVIVGQRLIVSSAWLNELWSFDLTETKPVATVSALPGRIDQIQGLADGRFVATWQERGVVSLLDAELRVIADQGVVYACADGLDNDGDGLTDHRDPDCTHGSDRTEAPDDAGVPEAAATESADSYSAGANFCNDGVDNDGNGLTDEEEGARCAKPDGEALAECGDGIDNDGDGATDTDDTSCYGPHGKHEGQIGPFGHYQMALVETGESGIFVYVSDVQRNRMAVFEVTSAGLERVDVVGSGSSVPEQPFRPFDVNRLTVACTSDEDCSLGDRCIASLGRCVDTLAEVVTAAWPERSYAGETDLPLQGTAPNSLLAARVRGELWERVVASGEVTPCTTNCSGVYQPAWCDIADSSTCLQPEGDGDTYTVFTPQADGKLRMIETVVRGVPRHRYAQSITNPEQRAWRISDKPSLTFWGRKPQNIGSKAPAGYAFMGPINAEEELEPAETGVSPARIRSYGLYAPPVETYEQVVTQSWAVEYEGMVLGTDGRLGRLVDATTFHAPGQRFCEKGVEPGDWLVIKAPDAAIAPALRYDVTLRTEEGDACALEPVLEAHIQVRVTSVGMHSLTVDPSTAQRVPVLRELDERAIRDSDKAILNSCKKALETYWSDELMVPSSGTDARGTFQALAETDWTPANLPARVAYEVRVADRWAVTGSVVGFAHPWRWDGAQCVMNPDIDARFQARVATAPFDPVETYQTCPPENDEVDVARMEALVDRDNAFQNYAFEFHMLPGCETDETAAKVARPDRRGTRWTFTVVGPDGAATSSLGEAAYTRRLGKIEEARAIVYMDTAGNRMRLLRFWHHFTTGSSFSSLFD